MRYLRIKERLAMSLPVGPSKFKLARGPHYFDDASERLAIPLGQRRQGIIENIINPSRKFSLDLKKRVVDELRDFTINGIYLADEAASELTDDERTRYAAKLEDTFDEASIIARSVEADNLLVLREGSSIIGYGSSNYYPDINIVYLSATMVSPAIPFSELAALRLNFFLVHNGLEIIWADAGQGTMPQIVTKTQNPMVLKYCMNFFDPYFSYGVLLDLNRTPEDAQLMRNKINDYFGWGINESGIIREAYLHEMRPLKMDLALKSRKQRENDHPAIKIIRSLKKNDAVAFAGDIKLREVLRLIDTGLLTVDPFESHVVELIRHKLDSEQI